MGTTEFKPRRKRRNLHHHQAIGRNLKSARITDSWSPMNTVYRPEIDGLRAIAVLGVVFFHLKSGLFTGGFAGVDIFFVISGYLITRNILADALAGSFSFSHFYARRARRILPALIFTIAITFFAGLWWLPPEDLQRLAREATAALLSISNIQYWSDSSAYFASASDQLALLHCWSLSLEEQFYLVWPALIAAGAHFRKTVATIAIAAIVSFIFALVWLSRDPHAVFFLMPFRIFEFAIGAGVIFCERKWTPRPAVCGAVGLFGLLAIGVTLVCFDSGSAFSLVTLLPSFGAAAAIFAGSRYRASGILTNPAARFVGRISYSLYLCHWPLLFFARARFGEAAESWQGSAVSFAIMLIVASAMQRWIEQPFRRAAKTANAKKTLIAFASVIAGFVVVTHVTFLSGGWPGRLPAAVEATADLRRYGMWPCKPVEGDRCAFGELDAPLGLELIGDSHAQHYVAALDPLLKERHLRGEVTTDFRCGILEGLVLEDKRADHCRATRDRELAHVAKNSAPVMISQNWVLYSNDAVSLDGQRASEGGRERPYSLVQKSLERTIQDMSREGRTFLIVGAQITTQPDCAFGISRRLPASLRPAIPFNCSIKTRAQAESETAAINTMLREVQAKFPDRVRLLIPAQFFCDKDCPIVQDGVLLYTDNEHFSVAGSKYIGARANKLLADFLRPKAAIN